MLRMPTRSGPDLVHCFAAFLSVGREKAFGSYVTGLTVSCRQSLFPPQNLLR